MFSFLPAPIVGLFVWTAIVLNTLIFVPMVLVVSAVRLLIPIRNWQVLCTRIAIGIAGIWINVNSILMVLFHPMHWHVEGLEALNRNQWYFVISNHQSWADIFVSQHLLNGRVPMLKFFLKQELIWVPLMGLCWWALDFPFMKRYSKAYLAKHPEKRGKDHESTKRACEKFQFTPVAVMNYMEGTRLTAAKHEKQESPFRYLLKPKAGGMGHALGAMNGSIKTLLDITIFYPNHTQPSFIDFLCGRVDRLCIRIEEKPIPAKYLAGNYAEDPDFRTEFQQWVTALWKDKDQTMVELHGISRQKGWSMDENAVDDA